MAAVLSLARMTPTERIGEAMRRSLPRVPAECRAVVATMLKPESLLLIGATLVAWAGSHVVGIGEIVDVVLLIAGTFTLGFGAIEGAAALRDFVTTALAARSDADLDKAGEFFARAVTLLGISVIQALLLRGQIRSVAARGMPRVRPLPRVGNAPAPGNALRLARPASIPGGSLGSTDAFGAIKIARTQTLTEQRITLFHELVHRYFSPRTGPLRTLRAQIGMSGYARSAFLRYLEEALAEGYGQLRVNGLAAALGAYRFPIAGGYVSVSQLASEGAAIGTITLGGTQLLVTIGAGEPPP